MQEILIQTTTINHLLQSAWDPQTVESYCRSCKNYDVHFSCPHHYFHIPDYLKQFRYALVVAHAIGIDSTQPETLAKHFHSFKQRLDQVLFKHEFEFPGSQAIIPGQCQICQPACETTSLASCPHPDLMRYSFESLGFDVSSMLKIHFDKILTFTEDQVQLVYGYLLQEPLSEDQLEQLRGWLYVD